MLEKRDTTGFESIVGELCASRTRAATTAATVAAITATRCRCRVTAAAAASRTARTTRMLRFALTATPVSVTATITQPSIRPRAGPHRTRARANAATTYTEVRPGGRMRRKPVSFELIVPERS